jgi:hypothetical protein
VTKKQQGVDPDNALRGRANAPKAELLELGQELREHGVSRRSRMLLAKLASYPPNVRLSINLKTTVGLMVNGPFHGVLQHGLTALERATLVELDMCGLSTGARELAHGLLSVHERYMLLRPLRRLFKPAVEAKEEYLVPQDHQEEPE